jgi:hypothetical protein
MDRGNAVRNQKPEDPTEDSMRKHSVSLVLAVVAGILVFSSLFVSFRARAFHYCMGFQEQPRVVSIDEPCSSDEQPLEWEVLGYAARVKLVGSTIVKAFGAN